MAVTEDIARLILEAEAKGFTDAASQIKLVEGSMGALTASYKSGAITYTQYMAEGEKLRGQLDTLKEGYKTAEDALRKYGNTADAIGAVTAQAQSKLAGFGQTALQTGRVVQDFAQGGIGGILNNIEGFTQAIGLGPGAAGALTILGVAAFALKPYLRDVGEALGLFKKDAGETKTEVEQLKMRLEELEKKPFKLTFDLDQIEEAEKRLADLRSAQAQYEANQRAKNTYERESGTAVKETLTESAEGLPALNKALRDQINAESMKAAGQTEGMLAKAEAEERKAKADIAELQKLLEGSKSVEEQEAYRGQIGETIGRRDAAAERGSGLRRKFREDAETATGDLTKRSFEGDVSAQRKLAERLRKSGRGGLAAGVDASSPESIRSNEQIEHDLEQSIERQRAGYESQKRKRAKGRRREAEIDREAKEHHDELMKTDPGFAAREHEREEKFHGVGQTNPETGREFTTDESIEGGRRLRGARVARESKTSGNLLPRRHFATPEAQRHQADARNAESAAQDIYQAGGGDFTPEQARELGRKAVQYNKDGLDAGLATQRAMIEGLAAMTELRAQTMALMQNAGQIGMGFRQLRGNAAPMNDGLLNMRP